MTINCNTGIADRPATGAASPVEPPAEAQPAAMGEPTDASLDPGPDTEPDPEPAPQNPVITGSRLARARVMLRRRFSGAPSAEAGMSTVEYAVGTIAAAAFGAVLYTVVRGDSIPDALGGIIEQALNTSV